ncbi:unnamed protein product, partial [Rotaria magnacalcarata]
MNIFSELSTITADDK